MLIREEDLPIAQLDLCISFSGPRLSSPDKNMIELLNSDRSPFFLLRWFKRAAGECFVTVGGLFR